MSESRWIAPLTGSYAMPWETLGEHERTSRLDHVLDYAFEFVYVARSDSYRMHGADSRSFDWCPAEDVEQRRKWRDSTVGGGLTCPAPKENQ